ncbi:MAG TPA: hypothetical protein VF712_09320 [Thermoleophilaceae bacterium]|jgi:hypothetical protein
MELVLANQSLSDPGGTETYLLTVAEEMLKLGHAVTLHAGEGGAMSELAERRGLEVALAERDLPSRPDAILTQDGAMPYALADLYPGVPQVFRAASGHWEIGDPPQLPGIVGTVVVLNDRLAEHVRRLGTPPRRVVRLRQPVDTVRYRPAGPLPERPRRVLSLGNYLAAARHRALAQALDELGLEHVAVGRSGVVDPEPLAALASAEIVLAKGRAALDAMACGRAVYVYDTFGTDGWVTPESYPALEADGFAGAATDRVVDPAQLAGELAGYRPEMGAWNREVVLQRHVARNHVHELLGVIEEEVAARGRDRPPPGTPLRELARLVRLQWQTEGDAIAARAALERTDADLRARAEAAEARVAELDERVVDAQRRAEDAERRAAEGAARAEAVTAADAARAEAAAERVAAAERAAAAAEERAGEAERRAAAAARRAEAAEAETVRLRDVLGSARVRAGLRAGRVLDRLRRR